MVDVFRRSVFLYKKNEDVCVSVYAVIPLRFIPGASLRVSDSAGVVECVSVCVSDSASVIPLRVIPGALRRCVRVCEGEREG